jgi:hypothetical protein
VDAVAVLTQSVDLIPHDVRPAQCCSQDSLLQDEVAEWRLLALPDLLPFHTSGHPLLCRLALEAREAALKGSAVTADRCAWPASSPAMP